MLPREKKALLLDMNNTFMFGEDRFGENEDYSAYYGSIGGKLPSKYINTLINSIYDYLYEKYPSEAYRHSFPSLEGAISHVAKQELSSFEVSRILETFSYHEHGHIPGEYVSALMTLKEKYTLALVIDIWSPKAMWLETFEKLGILEIFSAASFSSDHGMVKPSPKPFEMVIDKIDFPKEECVVIGDSVRRDLGGALAAGIDCVLVGNASDPKALACFQNLLEFGKALQ